MSASSEPDESFGPVQSLERAEGGILKLGLPGGKILTIGSAYLPPEWPGFFLRPGLCAGAETAAILFRAAECTAAERAALRLVARCEQCRRGLERKLALRRHGTEAIRAALDRLETLDLVNDRRYARLWLKSRLGRDRGPRILRALLAARGIGREDAEAALEEALTPAAEALLLERCLARQRKKKSPRKQPDKNDGPFSGFSRTVPIRVFLKREGFSAGAITRYFEEQAD